MNGWERELVRRWVFGYMDGLIMMWFAAFIVFLITGGFS